LAVQAPHSFVEYQIVRTGWLLEQRFRRTLAPFGLSPRQFSVLAALESAPGLTSAQLARAVLTTPQGMATILNQLRRRKLIEREDPETSASGRGVRAPVQLTVTGRELLGRAVGVVAAAEERTVVALSGEAATLNRLLAVVASTMSEPGPPEASPDAPRDGTRRDD
jgi:DNA-binding MarR family transcriptional regulator